LKEQTQNALGENVDERILLLETELVEAIEAKNMYKVQLQRYKFGCNHPYNVRLHDVMHERSLFSERVLRGPHHV